MATASGSTSGSPLAESDGNKRRGKKRIRAFTADERACHRLIEKQRREALNESFLDLARLVPELAPARRLSKSLIVHESIQYLRAQREMCIAAASEIQAILAENMELIAEVNGWREQYAGAVMGSYQVKPVGDAVLALLKVDQDVLGTFPGGFGDNATGEDHDEEHGVESGWRPQLEDQRDMNHVNVDPQGVPHTASNTGLDFPEYTSLQLHSEPQSLLADESDLPHTIGIPNSFMTMEPNRITTQQSVFPDEDPFSFLDNGYDISRESNAADILPTSTDFAQLNMHQDTFYDIDMQPSAVGNYLVPAQDDLNSGYMF